MRGIMRAPSQGKYFSIPYSGTLAVNDCILILPLGGSPQVSLCYKGNTWVYKDSIMDFSVENNVISFLDMSVLDDGVAAFIPGPNHV